MIDVRHLRTAPLWISLTFVLLAGCAQQRIRDTAQAHMQAADYERAVAVLDTGLADYPDSALLRAGVVQARGDALSRLLADAAASRALGNFDEAEAVLRRAQPFDTGGKRASGLLAEIAVDRRQRVALAEAEALVAKQQTQAALRVLVDALKDNPRQPDLRALQRKLEADVRQSQARASRIGLSETRPISLDFRDTSLRAVLDIVTRHSGINFILDKDVLRTDVRVTVLLRSVRVEDAVDLIVSAHQLAKKVVDPQTILIYPNTQEKLREHQEQVVRVFYLASAEAKSAAAFLRSMLRIKEPFVDERSNMLAIREAPENVELAERLIALYDTNEPEVLLEVEVIEVRSSTLTDLGVKFPDSFTLTPLPPAGVAGLTLGNIRGLDSDRVGLSIGGILVNLKRDVGDFNTLANPRIRAKNKEKARVMIGDKVPVITATTSQGGFVSDSVSYLDVGLKLDVEPTVYADDEVAIRVGLEVSSLAREVRTNSGSLAYQIGTRNASTLLRLRDGETQLLAGLISKDERTSASRVPGIGDLPIAGRLFSSQRDEAQRTELVLAITPRVLRNLRRPDASETEMWVGTEAQTKLRPVGAMIAPANATAATAAAPTQSALVPAASAIVTWVGPSNAAAGEVFEIALDLRSSKRLRGGPLQMSYSKDRLEVVEISEGDYFRASGAPTSFTKAVDIAAGRISVGVMDGGGSGVAGQGALVRVKLKALSAGIAEVAVTNLQQLVPGDAPMSIVPPTPLQVVVK
jgi:general secretion pathway protein D